MRIGSVPGIARRYIAGTWVIPGAVLVIALLAIRDFLVPDVPLWVGFVEFPLFLFAVFGPFVDAARREDRWHMSRGWIWNATEPRRRGWWASQFGFVVGQLRRPAWWTPIAFKLAMLVTVARFMPEAVRYVALLPIAVAAVAVTSILTTGWRVQRRWDRVVPGGDLPPWVQRRVDRWPLTAATVGLTAAAANAGLAFYFFSLDRWPLELACTVQCFWLGVTSLRRLAPAAPWRQVQAAMAPVVRPGRAA